MKPGFVRIIGGMWRGRKLKIPEVENLRPTPDRVRETLFNWLSPILAGANCLDAFAGSGVLGFEAISRGAKQVVLTDASPDAIKLMQEAAHIFKTTQAEIYCAHIPEQLKFPSQPFDVVFLDPPYQQSLLLPTCHYLEDKGFLAEQAYIYLEASEPIDETALPLTWQIIKSKKAGQVAYHLALRRG